MDSATFFGIIQILLPLSIQLLPREQFLEVHGNLGRIRPASLVEIVHLVHEKV